MAQAHVFRRKKRRKAHKPENEERARFRPASPDKGRPGLIALQQQVGNRAAQQLLARGGAAAVQRQEASRAGFNPLDPALIRAAAREVIAQNEAPVRRWLDQNLGRLRLLSLPEITARIRREVPEASRLADVELQSMAQAWARQHGFTLLTGPGAAAPGPRLTVTIPEAVKRAFSIATSSVDIVQLPNGRVNISVSGATALLGRAQVKVGWSGSLGLEIPMEGFHLGGQLTKDRWELTLSTPGASSVPDLTKLTELFQRAETALRGIVAATAGFENLDNVGAVQAQISPHIGPVKEAVQTLKNLAAIPPVSVGITAGGPMPGGETTTSPATAPPQGVSIQATITFRF
jgi:hypothetical protein